MSLKRLNEQIRKCRKCKLSETRNKAVPGEGNPKAKIMLIGQGPGRKEDETGRPFVGRAGKFLDNLLKKNKIDRKDCYITSIVKCMPPKNRIPTRKEAQTCVENYLVKQIELVNPAIVVLMGRIAERYTPKEELIRRKVIITAHPAAGMRFPKFRKKMEKDFRRIKNE